jgi:hypothetical protein
MEQYFPTALFQNNFAQGNRGPRHVLRALQAGHAKPVVTAADKLRDGLNNTF